jgi:serine/threonine-protein kinase
MSDGPPVDDPLIGRVVGGGRYEVLAVLGRGGMGTVYRARQRPLDRVVVLKLIHRELSADPGVVGRFEREMRVTAAIEHPNTVRVYDFGEIDGQPFLAMEHLAGRSVREVLDKDGAFPSPRLASVGLGVANALGAAHAAGIVHRDLKPDNVILVDAYGEPDFVKVLDFGIARPLEREMGYKTATGVLLGTPIYMSPEQCAGTLVDARSDLYALGVMLYEMAAGRPPFSGASFTAVLVAHATQPPPPLPPLAPDLPAPLVELIMALLAKSPDDRPAGAEEVGRALAPFARSAEARATAGRGRVAGAPQSSSPAAAPRSSSPSSPSSSSAAATARPASPTAVSPETSRGTGTRVLEEGSAGPGTGIGRGTEAIPPPDRASHGSAPPPRPGTARGAAALPAADSPGGEGRSRRQPALAVVAATGVLVLGGVAAVVVLRGLPGSSGPTKGSGGGKPLHGAGGKPERPVAGDGEAVARLLAAEGEPPWPAACQPDSASVRSMASAARALGPDADDGARREGLAALRRLPDDVPARWLIEARATLATDPDAAGRAAERAAALCPSSALARHLRGNALQKRQQLAAAEDAYREAAKLAPGFAPSRFNLGLCQLRRGAAVEALATLDPLTREHPDLPNLFLVRAEAHRRLGDTTAALAALEEQAKRHPESAEGWYQLGRARAARKLKGAADASCKAAELGHTEARALCKR